MNTVKVPRNAAMRRIREREGFRAHMHCSTCGRSRFGRFRLTGDGQGVLRGDCNHGTPYRQRRNSGGRWSWHPLQPERVRVRLCKRDGCGALATRGEVCGWHHDMRLS